MAFHTEIVAAHTNCNLCSTEENANKAKKYQELARRKLIVGTTNIPIQRDRQAIHLRETLRECNDCFLREPGFRFAYVSAKIQQVYPQNPTPTESPAK